MIDKEKTWEDLAKVVPPDRWILMYQHYQDLLTKTCYRERRIKSPVKSVIRIVL